MQSKKKSLIESVVNTLIGLGISVMAGYVIYPLLGIEVSHSQNLIVVAFYTGISIARGYLVRRYFNKR